MMNAQLRSLSHRRRVRASAATDWWDPNDKGLAVYCAFQPKGAGSFVASLSDLSGNNNDAGDPGGSNTPDWDTVNGWKFTGASSHYLTTTFVTQNDQTQSMIVQFTNSSAGNTKIIAGVSVAAVNAAFFLLENRFGGVSCAYGNGNYQTAAPVLSPAGNLCVAGNKGYRDGADEGVTIPPTGQTVSNGVYIGALNKDGTGLFNPWTGYIQAFALYSETLTADQVSAIASAMAAL